MLGVKETSSVQCGTAAEQLKQMQISVAEAQTSLHPVLVSEVLVGMLCRGGLPIALQRAHSRVAVGAALRRNEAAEHIEGQHPQLTQLSPAIMRGVQSRNPTRG